MGSLRRMRRDRDRRQRLNQLQLHTTSIVPAPDCSPSIISPMATTLSTSSTIWDTSEVFFCLSPLSSLLVLLLWRLSRLRYTVIQHFQHSIFLSSFSKTTVDIDRPPLLPSPVPYPTLSDIPWSLSLLAPFFALFYSFRIVLFSLRSYLGHLCIYACSVPSDYQVTDKATYVVSLLPHCITRTLDPLQYCFAVCTLLLCFQCCEYLHAVHRSCGPATYQCVEQSRQPSRLAVATVGSVALSDSRWHLRRFCGQMGVRVGKWKFPWLMTGYSRPLVVVPCHSGLIAAPMCVSAEG